MKLIYYIIVIAIFYTTIILPTYYHGLLGWFVGVGLLSTSFLIMGFAGFVLKIIHRNRVVFNS